MKGVIVAEASENKTAEGMNGRPILDVAQWISPLYPKGVSPCAFVLYHQEDIPGEDDSNFLQTLSTTALPSL